jgi:hypothetical protein
MKFYEAVMDDCFAIFFDVQFRDIINSLNNIIRFKEVSMIWNSECAKLEY